MGIRRGGKGRCGSGSSRGRDETETGSLSVCKVCCIHSSILHVTILRSGQLFFLRHSTCGGGVVPFSVYGHEKMIEQQVKPYSRDSPRGFVGSNRLCASFGGIYAVKPGVPFTPLHLTDHAMPVGWGV